MYDLKTSETVYSGCFINVKKDVISLPDGGETVREVVERGEACGILPINESGELIFVRQYRHPAGKMVLEIPAGVIDEGEDPLTCAVRELEEETGFIAGKIEKIFSLYTSIGFCKEKIHIYKAYNLTKGKQNFDEDEFIDVEVYSVKKAYEMIKSGEIEDSKTVAAILAFIGERVTL